MHLRTNPLDDTRMPSTAHNDCSFDVVRFHLFHWWIETEPLHRLEKLFSQRPYTLWRNDLKSSLFGRPCLFHDPLRVGKHSLQFHWTLKPMPKACRWQMLTKGKMLVYSFATNKCVGNILSLKFRIFAQDEDFKFSSATRNFFEFWSQS